MALSSKPSMMASPGRREFMLSNDACIRLERPLYLVRRFAVLTGNTRMTWNGGRPGPVRGARSGKKGSKKRAALENKHMDGAGAEVSFCREK